MRNNLLMTIKEIERLEKIMAGKRSGLGKGLDSLIPNMNTEKIKKETVVEQKAETIVKITDVEPNKTQPRKVFNEDALIELSESIRQFGVIQPLVVQKRDGYYEIIAGERRWRAAKLAGLKEVPVIVREYSDEEIMEIALIENLQREDLNAIEEALAYQTLMREFHLKQDEIADKVSKSRVAITNSMRLLKLPEEVQTMIIDDMISSGHGRALLALDNVEQQVMLANKIFDEKLSVRETEKLVKSFTNPKKEKEVISYPDESEYERIASQFQQIIGSNVSIKRKNKDKGKIEIEYYSNEDLERIVELLQRIQV